MTDAKAGWSTACRRGDVRQCETAGYRCANPRHKGRQLDGPARTTPTPRPAAEPKETPVTTPIVEWADPPPVSRGKRYLSVEQVAEFQSHPKRWGIACRYTSKSGANSACTRLKKGRNGSVELDDPDRWEFTARIVAGGSVLYARYLGEDG